MKFMLSLFLLSLAIITNANNKVIYGDDNRKDIVDSTNDEYKSWALSTAAMISNSRIKPIDQTIQSEIVAPTLGDRRRLCSDEPFRDQPAAANCSGFLVAPNILVTAGHCLPKNGNDYPSCSSFSWVFNFSKKEEAVESYKVENSDIFKCKNVISQVLNNSNKNDFAIIELDRDAVTSERTALGFRSSGTIEDKASLVVIGHPSGLPTKIADQANVRNNSGSIYFNANLDTYGGNSGSAVFNAKDGIVEGILVRGEIDYKYDSRGCYKSFKCADNGCRGEDVTRITNLNLDQYIK